MLIESFKQAANNPYNTSARDSLMSAAQNYGFDLCPKPYTVF